MEKNFLTLTCFCNSLLQSNKQILCIKSVGRDRSFGITTHNGLEGPEIKSLWRQYFPLPSRPALVLTQAPIQLAQVLFSGGKAAPTWPLQWAESPCVPPWQVIGQTLRFTLTMYRTLAELFIHPNYFTFRVTFIVCKANKIHSSSVFN